jgi:hypothetical protein
MAKGSRYRESGPATLGSSLRANVRLIVNCRECPHRVEPDLAGLVERYGAALSLTAWAERLRCSRCGGAAEFVVSGARHWT